MRTRSLLPLALAVGALAVPGSASADSFQQMFSDYKADGRLDQCYQPSQLHDAAGKIPPDIEQYAPGFGDALASGQGNCGSSAPADAPAEEDDAGAPVASGTAGPDAPEAVKKKTVREPPAPKEPEEIAAILPDPRVQPAATTVSSDTPGALIALLGAAAVALALALAWALAWFMGWNVERLTKPLSAAFQTMWDRLIPGR